MGILPMDRQSTHRQDADATSVVQVGFGRHFPARLRTLTVCLAAFILLAEPSPATAAGIDSNSTLVVFNKNDPDSPGLAQYYAEKRGIPASQVIGLNCPAAEEIQRADYDATIAAPLRKIFQKNGWWTFIRDASGQKIVTATTIRFVALIRGIPLKIAPDPTIPPSTTIPGLPELIAARNDASVDSELTTLAMPLPSPAGIVPNPYYRRFTPIRDEPVYPGFLLTARLDGPSPFIVRAMIDDAISAEKSGLWGWSYVDARGITSGGYAEGDTWMKNALSAMRQQGLPSHFDDLPPTFPTGYPITDAAVYYGWYAGNADGPFADPAFQFRPGAVAVHIHSFSAATLRSTTANWCGPLLARGAAATLGNVYEPYLSLTANLDIFQDRLMTGFTLAESAWMSQKALSWMGVVIGDPLYRPYASWRNHLPDDPSNPWQAYRRLVLNAKGDALQATAPLLAASQQTGDSLFAEGLGTAQLGASEWSDALVSFQQAAKVATNPLVRLRISLESIQALVALNRISEADALAHNATEGLPAGPQKNLFARFLTSPAPTPSVEPIGLTGPITVPTATPLPKHSPIVVSPSPAPSATPTPPPTPTPTPLPPPPLPEMRP